MSDPRYPKAFQLTFIETMMEEATGALRVLNECAEQYPEQIDAAPEHMRRALQEQIWKAAKPR
jgi:hypothetical protein